MYRDEGYGQNWQPESAANARRIDPYIRPCAVLGALFAVGFVLIVIIVLSLIPIYISHRTDGSRNGKKTIQAARVSISDYPLIFSSASSAFPLSQLDHRRALEATFTGLIQQGTDLGGSIVELTLRSARTTKINATLIAQITSNRTCATPSCLNLFQNQINQLLTEKNGTAVIVPYRSENSTEIEWIAYQLPRTIQSSVSSVTVDPSEVNSQLEKLLELDQKRGEMWKETQRLSSSSPLPTTTMINSST